ncbi:MAG: hypothetical protein NTX93_02025 [Bacteroidia bacterium]|nr:hypothetical protein [Bacteroidia bacterium]
MNSSSNLLFNSHELMTIVMFCTIYFYYLALIKSERRLAVSHYISEKYLFVVAHNVGFLKRFAGL